MEAQARKNTEQEIDLKQDQAHALARVVDEVRADAHIEPTRYLENSEVPEGGE